MRVFGIGLVVWFAILTGCRPASKPERPEPKLAKTIPAKYLSNTDPRLHVVGDTLYLNESYYTGFLVQYFPSGDTAFIQGYFNGLPEGRQAAWNERGMLLVSGFYINGKKEGLQQTWWPDGKQQLRYETVNHEYEGAFSEWNASGVLIKQFHYQRGQELGSQRLWWDNGTVRANYVIRNGRKYGLIGLKLCSNPNDSI